MNREGVKALLKQVLGPNISLVDRGKWVSLHCPFAPWRHTGGRDTRPSAGVSVSEDQPSVFNCLACGMKKKLPGFLFEYERHTGDDYSNLIADLEQDEFLGGGDLPEWDRRGPPQNVPPPPLDPEVYLDLYDEAYDHPYVAGRGIHFETARAINLRVDPEDSQGEERILFPVYHHHGGFYGFTGRATRKGVYPPIRDYHGLPKQFLLLGSHLLQPEDKYVILVEGLFDFAMLYQYGYPAMAYMGARPTDRQIDALVDIGLPVYLFGDNDKAGRDAQDAIAESRLCKHLPVMKVRYPKRLVPKKDGKLGPITDPDELTREEVAHMIDDARILLA